MTENYYPAMHTTEENLAVLCSDYPDFLTVNPPIKERKTTWGPDNDGELLLALMNYGYGVGKNSLIITKENEFNLAEVLNYTSDTCYIGGSPKSVVAALLIAILNYHLRIEIEYDNG